jgi:TolB-like protein
MCMLVLSNVRIIAQGNEIPLTSLRCLSRPMVEDFETEIRSIKYSIAYKYNTAVKDYQKDTEYVLGGKYEWFICEVGFDDTAKTDEHRDLKISVDGKAVEVPTIIALKSPVKIKINVKDVMRIRFDWGIYYADVSKLFRFINPRVVIGEPIIICPNCSQRFASNTDREQHIKSNHQITPLKAGEITQPAADWPYAIDPKDLETLAVTLRKRINANPELKLKIQKDQIALMTFNLIDIPKLSVADKVAENLSTSLINNDFLLVERGQLDKAFKELKLQVSGVIDPATAKKIGDITGCDNIIVGSISDEGLFVVINARLLDTSTGKALAAERVEMRKMEIKR